jgi:hypothetical protein
MAKITDPDSLNQGTEVDFITGSIKVIRLNKSGSRNVAGDIVEGNLSTDGVTMQALYSFIKEEWRDDTNLIKFNFPMISITSEQFEIINTWDVSGSYLDYDSGSKFLIRDGGWAKTNADGNSEEEFMNITTLGNFDDAAVDKAYFLQTSSFKVGEAVPIDFVLPGPVNQGVLIYKSGSAAATENYRGVFKVYLREDQKTYAFYDLLTEQNLTTLTTRKFALPLANAVDLKVITSSAVLDPGASGTASLAPYSSMSLAYYDTSQTRDIGGTDYSFKVVVDNSTENFSAGLGTLEHIYTFTQWAMTRTHNVNELTVSGSGSIRGDIAEQLCAFVGDTLKTNQVTQGGVYIDNFLAADTNRLQLTDNSGSVQTFPFVAAGSISFNDNLKNDASGSYKVFFTNDDAGDDTARDFGTQNAIIAQDNTDNPLTGSTVGLNSANFDYDYDGNIQRGNASSGSDAPVTAVALGFDTAQYVITTSTIARSTTNAINLVAALERNYTT